MYYHIRLDKIKHDACTDMDTDWMYPDGHDDGECIGEMFEGND